MGNLFTKNIKIIPIPANTKSIIIITDINLNIVYVNDIFYNELSYINSVIGKSINILMNEVTVKTHDILFKNLYKMTDYQIYNIIKIENDLLQKMRYINIRDNYNKNIKCNIKLTYNKELKQIHLTINKLNCFNNPQIPHNNLLQFTNEEPRSPDKSTMINYDNCICILIDLANSTKLNNILTTEKVIKIYNNIYKITQDIINKYYPYIKLHETCGDSLFLIIEDIKNIKQQEKLNYIIKIISTIIYSINEYIKNINEMLIESIDLYMRCGVSMGNLIGTIVDGRTYRLFGQAINKASRLESICDNNSIIFDSKIYDTYCNNFNIYKPYVTIKDVDLKGFEDKQRVYFFNYKNFLKDDYNRL